MQNGNSHIKHRVLKLQKLLKLGASCKNTVNRILEQLNYTSGPKVVTIFVDVSFHKGFPHSLYGVLGDSPQTVFPLHFYGIFKSQKCFFSFLTRSSTVDQGSTVLNRFLNPQTILGISVRVQGFSCPGHGFLPRFYPVFKAVR